MGYYTARWILSHTSIVIENFLVTDKKYEVESHFGIPVLQIGEQEADREKCIIIATSEHFHEDISSTLKESGYLNVHKLPNSIYCEIRKSEPDVLGEQYSLLKYIKRKMDILQDLLNPKFYGSMTEKNNCLERFSELQTQNSYWEMVQMLVKGLDSESKDEIYRILHRIKLMSEEREIVYTDREKSVIQEIEENFHKKIYEIEEGRIIYNDYILPTNNFEEVVFWYEHGITKLSHPEYIVNKDAIDAGAFIGDSALVLEKYIKGKIHSFEASAENINTMKKTLQLNNKESNIIPVNMALSDYEGEMVLFDGLYSRTSNSVVENSYRTSEKKSVVPCTTIDNYVKEHQLTIGLIKTDVEGAELNLLIGAEQTIREQKPTMIISIYHSLDDFFKIKLWVENLNLGYSFKIFRPIIKNRFMLETALICEVN